MSTSLLASTDTPGSTAPLVSLTKPEMVLCAEAARGITRRPVTIPTRRLRNELVDIGTPCLTSNSSPRAADRLSALDRWNGPTIAAVDCSSRGEKGLGRSQRAAVHGLGSGAHVWMR